MLAYERVFELELGGFGEMIIIILCHLSLTWTVVAEITDYFFEVFDGSINELDLKGWTFVFLYISARVFFFLFDLISFCAFIDHYHYEVSY